MMQAASVPVGRAVRTRWWVITLPVLVVNIVSFIDKINVAIVQTSHGFLAELGLLHSPGTVGLITTLFLWAYGIGIFLWGAVVDRYGARLPLIVGVAGWGVCMLAGAAASNVGVIFASRIGLGLFEGVMWPASIALTGYWFPVRERARAQAIWSAGLMLGAAVAGLLVTAMLVDFGWRGSFIGVALINLVICLPYIVIAVRDRPAGHPWVSRSEVQHIESETRERVGYLPRLTGLRSDSRWATVLASPAVWVLSFAYICTNIGFWGVATWFPSFLRLDRHVSPAVMGSILTGSALLAIVVQLAICAWSDRAMKRAPFLAGSLFVAGVLLFLGDGVSALAATAALTALAFSLTVTATQLYGAILHSMLPEACIGLASGLVIGIGNFVGSFSPAVMGVMIGMAHGSYTGAFAFIAACLVVGGLAAGSLTRQAY
jgi:ACS family glucarate transporter-like MFS transporter